MNKKNNINNIISFIGGTMIITGTTIGSGIFFMPFITAGAWFINSLFLLIFTWLCMLFTGFIISDYNIKYPNFVNIHTMVKKTLPYKWNLINNIATILLLYSLIYYYITIGTDIIYKYAHKIVCYNQYIITLFFVLLTGIIIALSNKTIQYLSTILMIIMIISFIFSIYNLINNISVNNILEYDMLKNIKYIPITLPYLITAFGYHTIIPVIISYYKKNNKLVKLSLFTGTIIALIFYILWELAIQGNISRNSFKTHIIRFNDFNSLIEQINYVFIKNNTIKKVLYIFLCTTIISSLLGASLGLKKIINSLLKFKNNLYGNIKSNFMIFFPPIIFSITYPYSMMNIMNIATISSSICTIIIPALLINKNKNINHVHNVFYTYKKKLINYFLILFGISIIIIQILSLLNIISQYTN